MSTDGKSCLFEANVGLEKGKRQWVRRSKKDGIGCHVGTFTWEMELVGLACSGSGLHSPQPRAQSPVPSAQCPQPTSIWTVGR